MINEQVTRTGKCSWIISHLVIFHVVVSDIKSEPINALIQPEPENTVYFVSQLRVSPVYFRLLWRKVAQVVLLCRLVPMPSGLPSEPALPVIWNFRFARPNEVVVELVLLRLPAFNEPGMLLGRMVQHKIDDNLNVKLMSFF